MYHAAMRYRALYVPLATFALIFVQAAVFAAGVRAIGPIDEQAHFDNVIQIRKGNFPVPAGVRYAHETVREWACRPVDRAASIAALCEHPDAETPLPYGGINYEARYGPVYYVTAAAGSAVLDRLGVNTLTGTRLVSAFCYALGAALLVVVVSRFAISRLAVAGFVLLVSTTGAAFGMGVTVGPDAMVLLLTAAAIATPLLPRSLMAAALLTAVAGLLIGLTKPSLIVCTVFGSVLLGARLLHTERASLESRWRSIVRGGVAIVAPLFCTVLSAGGWAALSTLRGVPGASYDGGIHERQQSSMGLFGRTLEHVRNLLFASSYEHLSFTILQTPLLDAAALVITIAVIGACFCSVLVKMQMDWQANAILRAALISIPLSAVLLTVMIWAAQGGAHVAASRFGIPLLAGAAAALGAASTRAAAIPIAGLAVLIWATAFLLL